MATVKRLNSSYTIDTTDVIITGNLTVQGIQTTVESTNTSITDRILTLNSGETGNGVTLVTAGIEVDRGNLANVALLWNESLQKWQLTTDGSTYTNIMSIDPNYSDTPVVYSSDIGFGGSGIYVINGPAADQELITATRAFGYSLLF